MSTDLELANPGLSREELDLLIASRRRRRWIVVGFIFVFAVLPALGWFGWKFYERGPSAQNHYELALAHQAQGDLQAALIELKNTLKKSPDNGEARLRLGQIYLELGNAAAAEKELGQARGLEAPAEEVELGLLRVKLLQRDFETVLAGLDGLSSRSAQALLLRGDVMLALARIPEARAAYEALLTIERENIDGHLGLARALMASDDVEAVDRHLADALAISETSFKTSTTKGDIAAARQDHEKARVAYERALELRGRDVAVRVSLSRALLELGEIEAADKYLGKLHKAFPKTPIVNYLRAVSATQRGDLEEAKAALLSVLSAAPGHLESFFLLATIHYHEKNFEEAEASVQRVLDTVPDHLPSAKLLAALQVDQQRPEKAVEILNAVLPAAPDDVQLLALLGGAYMRAGEFDKANETLARAAKLAPDVASVRTQLALSQFGSGKSEQALAELSAASALNPEFAQADLLLIGVHLERGEYDEAVVAAQGFAEKQPANPMPHNLMGGAYEGLGDLAKARAAYHQALSLDPNFGAAVLNLARLELNEGNEDGARQRYDSVLAHTPHHPAVLSRLATLDFAAGDTNKAVERLEESRRHNPEDLSSRLSLAGWYLQTGKFAEAFPVAEEAFDLAPKLPQTITVLSRAELVNGKGESAIARLTALTKAYPESTEAFYQLAGTQIALGRTAAAAVSYNEVLRLDTEHAGATLGLGQVALLEGRFSDAIQTARLIQASHPESPEGYALEGDARFAGGNPKAAVKVYEAALQRASTTPLTIALSRAHKASGREDRATEVLLEWLKQHPDDLRVKAIRAESALVSGNRESAIETYEQIIAQAPDDVGVLNNLAYLYDQKNDPRALEFARKAYELAPAHPAIMDTYGWLLVRAGEVQRGLPILEESVAKSPENTEHRLHLGAALVTAGKTDKAREVLAALAGIEDEFPEKAEAQALLDLIE